VQLPDIDMVQNNSEFIAAKARYYSIRIRNSGTYSFADFFKKAISSIMTPMLPFHYSAL
jgi:hypothetical protein